MLGRCRRVLMLGGVLAALLGVAPLARAQDDSADEGTSLTITGGLETELDGSQANACVAENGDFRAHLTSLTTSTTILTFEVRASGPGIFPVTQGNRVTLVSLSDDPAEFLVNWSGSGGTLTISSLDAQVQGGDGGAATRGATGSIDADLSDEGHDPVHISGSWACHFPT
jgi:hypothetical protein